VSGHIKSDWLIIAKGGVFTGNVTELEGLFILLPVRTVIRPEGPGWTRLRALTLSHAVGPNRLPQLTPPRKPAGARESYLQIGLKRAIEGVSVSEVMTSDCPTVSGNMNLQHFVEEELLPTGRRCFVVLENGAVAGLVTPHEVKQVERARWPFTTLHDIMRPLDQMRMVTPETPLISALEMMSRQDLNQLPVVSNGRLAGVLSRAHLLSFLQTRTELQA